MTQITEEVRDQLLEASAATRKAFSAFRREADPDDHYQPGEGAQAAADKAKDDLEMSAVVTIMQPILRFLQLLCENHNRDLQVRAGWGRRGRRGGRPGAPLLHSPRHSAPSHQPVSSSRGPRMVLDTCVTMRFSVCLSSPPSPQGQGPSLLLTSVGACSVCASVYVCPCTCIWRPAGVWRVGAQVTLGRMMDGRTDG